MLKRSFPMSILQLPKSIGLRPMSVRGSASDLRGSRASDTTTTLCGMVSTMSLRSFGTTAVYTDGTTCAPLSVIFWGLSCSCRSCRRRCTVALLLERWGMQISRGWSDLRLLPCRITFSRSDLQLLLPSRTCEAIEVLQVDGPSFIAACDLVFRHILRVDERFHCPVLGPSSAGTPCTPEKRNQRPMKYELATSGPVTILVPSNPRLINVFCLPIAKVQKCQQ